MGQKANKIKVYSEDTASRWFIRKLIPEYLPYLDILDVEIGCTRLLSLCAGDISYFRNVLIVLNGSVKDEDLQAVPEQLRKRINNIIKLPGITRPEELIYKYILNLDPEHPYWENASKVYMNWIYFKENGPDSPRYEQENDKYKKWFVEHQMFFDSTKLFEFWAADNKELVEEFKESFIESYNTIANRISSTKFKV